MPSDGYIAPQIETDPAGQVDRAMQVFAERFPNATLPEGSMLLWDVETDAQTAAETTDGAINVAAELATQVLSLVVGEQQRPAIAATGTATLTVSGATAVTIPAGTVLEAIGPDGDPVGIETVLPATAVQGVTSIPGVLVQALEENTGEDANGTTGDLDGMDQFPFGISATLTTPLANGQDPETDDEFLGRLVRLARISKPRPVTGADVSEYVALTVPGVGSAITLENRTPTTSPVAGAFTVGIRAIDGTAPPSTVVSAALAQLQANLTSTITPYVVLASYTTVNVAATVKAWPGYDYTAIQAQCVQLIRDYLNPATWGAPPQRGDVGNGGGTPWNQQTTVRVAEVIEQLGRAVGVDYTDRASVTLSAGSGTASNNDLTLSGLLPLPMVGTITITVQPR